MKTQPAITARDLTRRFGKTVAVDRLNLEVNAGEIFGFLGHNGAGKTTTVRLLNGVLSPNGGEARVLGLDPVTEGAKLRLHTGVLTETPALDERLTARYNLHYYADLYNVPRPEVASRIETVLKTADIVEHAEQKVGTFSKGMKQRLALARALLHEPEVLFLDEPTSGLDPIAAHHVHRLITHLSKEEGRTIFLCTHNLVEAQQLCDRVAVLEHGRLIALGTPGELIRQLEQGLRLRVEIEVSQESVSPALEKLSTIATITADTESDGIITILGASREMVPELIMSLAAAQVRIYRVTPHEPSLQDVYFALHHVEEVQE